MPARAFRFRHLMLPAGLAVLAACADAPTAANLPSTSTPALSRDITLDSLGQAIGAAPQRVEINLSEDALVALQVELKTGDELTRDESVRGRVMAMSASGDAGTLTLGIGGLAVSFDAATEFRSADGAMVAMADFVAQVQAALDAGGSISVRASRPAPTEPHAPDDAAFAAARIRLSDCLVSPELSLNVDGDNFALNDTPPPDAYFHVLGLAIEVRTQDGTTRIKNDTDYHREAGVRGLVAAVDLTDSTVTLVDGTVIVILPETRIEGGWREEREGHLASLDSVAAAVAAGDSVKAEAEGVVDGTDATRFLAREVEFERVTEDHGRRHHHDCAELMAYQGAVSSVSVGDDTFTLEDGTVVKLMDRTMISDRGDLTTLQAVADALAAGTAVSAEGWAVVQDAGPPMVLVAVKLRWATTTGD
jgi:hypothetical protein